jgi:cell division protein FtsL
MNLDVEYAIKKDIRNNPVVRTVDAEHKRELIRTIGFALAIVAMLLFWVWQRFGIVQNGYTAAQMQTDLAIEKDKNRQLTLEVDMLRAPKAVEDKATKDLHMVAPSATNTVVIDAPAKAAAATSSTSSSSSSSTVIR